MNEPSRSAQLQNGKTNSAASVSALANMSCTTKSSRPEAALPSSFDTQVLFGYPPQIHAAANFFSLHAVTKSSNVTVAWPDCLIISSTPRRFGHFSLRIVNRASSGLQPTGKCSSEPSIGTGPNTTVACDAYMPKNRISIQASSQAIIGDRTTATFSLPCCSTNCSKR